MTKSKIKVDFELSSVVTDHEIKNILTAVGSSREETIVISVFSRAFQVVDETR